MPAGSSLLSAAVVVGRWQLDAASPQVCPRDRNVRAEAPGSASSTWMKGRAKAISTASIQWSWRAGRAVGIIPAGTLTPFPQRCPRGTSCLA